MGRSFASTPSLCKPSRVQDKQLLQFLLWQCLMKRAGSGDGTSQAFEGFAR